MFLSYVKTKKKFLFSEENRFIICFSLYVEKMYITKIHHEFEGDTFFPEVNYEEWNEVFAQKDKE